MTTKLSYSEARQRLSSVLDQVTEDRETVIITRRGKPDAAVIAADDLRSLVETAYLLRSPANARQLFDALEGAMRGEGERTTVEALRREFGLDRKR